MRQIITFIFCLSAIIFCVLLTSCKENTEYKLLETNLYNYDGILGGGADTLRAGEAMVLKTYYSSIHFGKMECKRNGLKYSIPDTVLANTATGALLREDQTKIEHRTIAEMIKIRGVSREDSRKYFFYAVYALCVILFISLPICIVLLNKKTFESFKTATFLIAIPSMIANICYTYYTLTMSGNSYWFLFSPSEHGFWWMIADWLAFFVLSFVNLAAFFGVLVITRMAYTLNSNRPPFNVFLQPVFLFFVVELVVYIFSSTAYNNYFIVTFLGMMVVHLMFMIFGNRHSGADVSTIIMLWAYMWICLPAVFISTIHAVILIPLLFYGGKLIFSSAKSVALSPLDDIVSRAGNSSSEGTSSERKSSHYCADCSFYEQSSGRCFNSGATTEGPFRVTSCPFYKS